ncbi:MAG TPA: hypothetical protein VN656_02740 [Stellaceae bacterium]|jgi:hypothetical protein|nr:hypothetical protein [Stellaceae bacterium]
MATEGTAAWYRERATKLRELATRTRDPDARAEQMKMAEQFDRLAQRAEAKERKSREG